MRFTIKESTFCNIALFLGIIGIVSGIYNVAAMPFDSYDNKLAIENVATNVYKFARNDSMILQTESNEIENEFTRRGEIEERFTCDISVQVTSKERKFLFFTAAGCAIGYASPYFSSGSFGNAAFAWGSVISSALGFFAGSVGGANSNPGKRDLFQIGTPLSALTNEINVPRIIGESGYTYWGTFGNDLTVALMKSAGKVTFTTWVPINGTLSKRDAHDGYQQDSDYDYVNLNADEDNDYRSKYFGNDVNAIADTLPPVLKYMSAYIDRLDQTEVHETCVVPQDSQGNSVFSGTMWINQGTSGSGANCDGLSQQMIGNFDATGGY